MVQVPAAFSVAIAPDTAQTTVSVDAKLTGNPELAVAFNAIDAPTVCVAIAAKVIVCDARLTVKLCVTEAAAA